MEIINSIFFFVIAITVVLSALGVVLSKNIVYSAISLIITFLSIAGIFILLNADFVAISQIIIYGVGITIILIFAIMLTSNIENENLWIANAPRTLLALIVTPCLFLVISYAITNGFTQKAENTKIFNIKKPSVETVSRIQEEGTSKIIGEALLTKYVLPFEVLSLLLLAAILGATVIAKKDEDDLTNPTTDQYLLDKNL